MSAANTMLPDTLKADRAWMSLSKAVCVWVVAIFLALAVLQTVVIQLLPPTWQLKESAAVFGDMFGSINALSSALAFALLLVTLRMQAVELKEQREQFQKMADAQTASDEKMLLQTYLNALALESENDLENDKPEGTYTARLNKMVLQLKFGRRAAWVRRCIEADLSKLPRPEPPDFQACQRVDQHMKYWRILAHYLDCAEGGERSHAAAVRFCKKMTPLFESEYWRSIPSSTLKDDVASLADQLCKLKESDESQAFGSAHRAISEPLERICLKFPAIVATICFPAELDGRQQPGNRHAASDIPPQARAARP